MQAGFRPSASRQRPSVARASSPCIRRTDSRVRASSAGRRRYGLDSPVQATLCLGETPQPRLSWHGLPARASVARSSAGRRRYKAGVLTKSIHCRSSRCHSERGEDTCLHKT
ncbi:MAG: hypothetical protein NZ843_04885 [Fimbriimonadales bacterium]|nr:hypothetical protein [Fimbriimonadales bacterium]